MEKKMLKRVAGAPMSVGERGADAEDIEVILHEVRRAGYLATNETVKLAEFRSPSGHTIYVVKQPSRLNDIKLRVHPSLDPLELRSLEGVDSISNDYRFHSNMVKFPKRHNKGKKPIAHAWQINIQTIGDLSSFLRAFDTIGF